MDELIAKEAEIADIPHIVNIAYGTWFKTYEEIISKEQIDFMFGEMYTPEAIFKQMDFLKHQYLLVYLNQVPIGFASFSKMVEPLGNYKLHKLYLLPQWQGIGAGLFLLTAVEELCKSRGAQKLQLNVNRHNKAKLFYEKCNYTIIETIDIAYGNFWLNDYVMEKNLN